MASARGDALDWALALARAPGERHALRQRPLPDGIEPLLQIAAGRQGEVLQAAISHSGEPETELVEAVRFYLREVLFHSGADAYRVLGLTHDAAPEQVKAHHRLLQQWLHPDRHTSDWDAIFAGRVNAAWNALRTPERRAEYDALNPVAEPPSPAATRWVAPRVVAGVPLVVEAHARWRRRAPVLALFAACGILGVAAVRDALREPDGGYAASAAAEAPPARRAADAVALALPTRTTKPAQDSRPQFPRRKAAESRSASASARPAVASARPSGNPPMPTIATRVAPTVDATVARPAPPVIREIVPTPLPQLMPAPATVVPSIASSKVPASTAPVAAPSTPAPVASAPVPNPPTAVTAAPAVASADRVQQAQRTGRRLLAFLSAPSGTLPPIWDSLAAQQRAVRLRDSLHASGNTRAGDPQWRVAPEDAAMQAAFGDDAQVRAQLVWREQRWLVSGVALEQAP